GNQRMKSSQTDLIHSGSQSFRTQSAMLLLHEGGWHDNSSTTFEIRFFANHRRRGSGDELRFACVVR
ncbi:MAG: hypothetical protein KDA85_02215, partial [Planctomycetaceae bacterium]|nr:hypothetical protein [Planctomycetaceae bacterium]